MNLPDSPYFSKASIDNPWVGIDIGGANLKVAHSTGWSNSCAFPMWKQSRMLAHSIAMLLAESPAFQGVAITMTGELADCFATRSEGVAVILEQVTSLIPASMVRVYDVEGKWRSVSQAAREPWQVAASNWHALARMIAKKQVNKAGDACLLIDVGSTTSDIIPIHSGEIAIEDRTDSQRLISGALVYTGVERSNLAGIVRELPLYGNMCPVMNEQFSTALDIYLWLGLLEENVAGRDTADNGSATREGARFRLARLVGEDGSTLTDSDVDAIAHSAFGAQASLVASGIKRMFVCLASKRDQSAAKKSGPTDKRPKSGKSNEKLGSNLLSPPVIMSGHGDFLIEAALQLLKWDGQTKRLSETLGDSLSRCAPAFSIATLASEELTQ